MNALCARMAGYSAATNTLENDDETTRHRSFQKEQD